MTRYYFNESPQVTYWKEKHAKLLIDYSKLLEKFEDIADATDYVNFQIDKTNKEMKQFNSLPWYKKLFYKFKV